MFFRQFVYNFNRNTDGNIFETIKTPSKLCLCSCHSMAEHYPIRILFRPQLDILSRFDRITSRFGTNTIGVHIRRTDHIKAIKQSPLTAFYAVMQQEIENNCTTNFFLATDDEDVKREMICRFGNKIISCNDNASRNSVEGMKFAVVDLFCLSNTKKIIGSAASSYSELAAELGGIELYLAQSHNYTECTP